MEIKKLNHDDVERFIQLILVFEEVFEMQNFVMPPPQHLSALLSKPDFIVFVAEEEDKVIAGLTAYTLTQYYSEKPLAYIYDLAVLTKYQRQGIGKKLIAAINAYCQQNNYQEVFVQADVVDDYALDFYRGTHPTNEEDVIHFYYSLG
ncbi:GNAT family N-acetyltransferase [Adhaeribacter swui]|uniref:GNAT family N-acetyltransferase n=1 Tax=Adhaeribacter swui TaxID=2086471 RepID=A0A7G7GBR5_9BACT|nr:GNAT family N-acetyltransferase [Adhaeribacter swui]QNF34599.1 GNAT family N-acetyltransferase [Adhaeribacter swui]